jgi:hypothetical protein
VRLRYRSNQFFNALQARPTDEQLAEASEFLGPDLMALFLNMQPSEQAHSVQVYEQLLNQGETNTDLLAAALLHDVGKAKYPLRLWERVMIVLVKNILPGKVGVWGQAERPSGWKRAFTIAEQHPAWGAQMVADKGGSAITVDLIHRHQNKLPAGTQSDGNPSSIDQLLYRLQSSDNES